MRKLAYLLILIGFVAVIAVTLAAVNYGNFRDTAYTAIQGTVLMPIHDFVVNTFINIGAMGFTYIMVHDIIVGLLGIVVGVGLIYGLIWEKLIQDKLLHKTAQAVTPYQSVPQSNVIPLTNLQSQPTQQEPKKE